MPGTYAVLGATGSCGSALMELLRKEPENRIHAYCRNKPKLVRLMPSVTEDKRVTIFEGAVTDVDLIVECLRGTHAVFICTSTNTNVPGYTVGHDAAQAIIAALRVIKEQDAVAKMPKLVVLSSASIDPHLSRKLPGWGRAFLLRASSFVYEDLRKQETFLRSQEDWVKSIFVKPGGLSTDKQRGHQLNFDTEETYVSYLDLSAAMIEAADDPDGQYDMRSVSVTNTNGGASALHGTPGALIFGFIRHFFPSLHPYLPTGY